MTARTPTPFWKLRSFWLQVLTLIQTVLIGLGVTTGGEFDPASIADLIVLVLNAGTGFWSLFERRDPTTKIVLRKSKA